MKLAFCVLSALMLITACNHHDAAPPPAPTPAALTAHSEEFRQGVVQVTDGVYVAIGYGIANSILLVGSDGLVVVDTTESLESGRNVLAQFRKLSDQPVRAIVYTHSHPDHIGGAGAFAQGNDVAVYAQEDVARNMDKIASELQPVITRRSMRMYGALLTPEERVNIGIGPQLETGGDTTVATLRPTIGFRDELEVSVAGIRLQLIHAPGETADQIMVWLPDRKVLLPGDNIYKAFPNLYTIRGTSYRDPKLWATSLDRMRALRPQFLVPSHGRPISGADAIAATLTDYRDAIRYVYDQSIRWTNQGLLPDEIAARVQLPPHLAASPYLQPFYGKPSWSAKTVFDGNLGWFDGDPTHLQPLPPDDEARRMVELAGGATALTDKLVAALDAGDTQWALQLSGYVLRVDAQNARAKQARIAALRTLGLAETNPPARGYYLMSARELAGEITLPPRLFKPTAEMIRAMPLSTFFDGMAVNLKAEQTLDQLLVTGFDFGSDGQYTYLVRRGVSELVPGIRDDAALVVRADAQVFKEMLAGTRNPALTIAKDFEMAKGGKLDFVRFMQLFEPESR